MRLPIIPFIVAVMLLTAAFYVFFISNVSRSSRLVLDAPRLNRIADIDGTETEVAIAPDGDRYALIVSGDLWSWKLSTGEREQLTETPETEFFPVWTPDGKRITFSRGADTFAFDSGSKEETLFKSNANWLSWSPTGRIAFMRDRALWLADPNGQNEQETVKADANPDIAMRTPRFSPDSIQLAFIKSALGLRGEVWIVNVLDGSARALVADRAVENPSDLGWILDGRHLVYLTNRAGAYSIWHIDFTESQILPLTPPLVGVPLDRIGIGVWRDRIVVPRHFVDSNIVTSDGTTIAGTEYVEFEPSVSPNGKLVAYTLVKDNYFHIWTAGVDGSNATFRAVGREPQFSANGFEIAFTQTDLSGNEDIWRIDIRHASVERVTDADEIDIAADWSPDGRTIAFSSARGGAVSVWTTPASGGKRLRLNDGGYGPRYSPDGRSILFWNKNAMWTMNADGGNIRKIHDGPARPTVGVWSNQGPIWLDDRTMWPRFDMLPDGRRVIAPIEIHETSLWAVDLTYKEN